MGHQVNFFLTPTDAAQLALQLRTLGERWGLLLVQPDLLTQVILDHVATQRYWSVDQLTSPVIEFSPGGFFDKGLREGRLYYVDGLYGPDGQWQHKPEAFRKWAKSVLAKTRRVLKRRGSWYVGPDAERWQASGGGRFMTDFNQVVNGVGEVVS